MHLDLDILTKTRNKKQKQQPQKNNQPNKAQNYPLNLASKEQERTDGTV